MVARSSPRWPGRLAQGEGRSFELVDSARAPGAEGRATTAFGSLCQRRLPLLALWSGHHVDRSTALSHYPSCAKASRSLFSCSWGRFVEMISKSYAFSSSMILSGAVAPLVRANSAEV